MERDLSAGKLPPDVAYVDREGLDHEWRNAGYVTDPYKPQVAHEVPDGVQVPSFFRDLLVLAEERQRKQGTFRKPVFRVNDPGPESPPSFGWPTPDEARARLTKLAELEQRDLSTSTTPDLLRPSAPGYLIETWGRAAAQTSTLLDVFERRPLEPGMVDVSGGVPTVKFPRLVIGPMTAVQAADNAAIQETDATSTSASAPVATIAGQEDMARQLLEFSAPGMDEVIMDGLARDFGSKFDSELVNGSATSGHTRGLLNVSGIVSVTGAVTSVQAFIDSTWKAFSQLAGGSGFGNPNPDEYVTLVHPRRLAWAASGTGSTTVPIKPYLPGTVVSTAGLPTTLGGGTNEDVALIVEKSNVLVLGGTPQFRIFEEVGSATQTVRISGWGSVAVLLRNPTAVAKVTGLTAPAGY
jgi:hypothetical protein